MHRFVVIAMLGVVIAACSGRGPQRVGAQPSWRGQGSGATKLEPVAGPVTFAPASQPASRYNEGVQLAPSSALGDAVMVALKDAAKLAGTTTPIADARMFRACAELAEIVPEEGVISYSLVEFALQRNGIIEPSPHLLVVWGDIDSPQLIVDQLRPRLAEILADGASARVGIGVAKRLPDGTGAVVFALQASGVSTSPIPRSITAGGSFLLDAVVDVRYKSPEVFVTRNTGTTDRLELKHGASGGFTTRVSCASFTGRQQVEITASDAQGSTVLANFPVWCGTEPPLSLTVTPSLEDAPVADPLEAEKRLLALVNRDRGAAGLHALLWDAKVADVARAHSSEMRRTKVVAHISPTTGSAADRVRVAKLKTALVLENVARAYGLGEAHNGLMNSPGHRANLMSTAATHIGIGVIFGDDVSGRREIFITQVFTRIPPKIDPTKAADAIRDKISAVRKVSSNIKLVAIAQQLADQLAAGKTRDQAWPTVRRQIDALGNQYERVGSVITAASELESIDGKSLIGDTQVDDIGVGVTQGPHPEIGDNAMWIVVLLAKRR
ncbi:MAG: CAP domain-containing protein [Deltaproteobacteria bacterium]|nr:CAP domain-containing protein [Deltaproteobacteria bacterium]MDQ3299106.1 CAP domain-containing protein [Myxococcota bacterium]